MKKIIGGAVAALALVAFMAVPKSSAATGATLAPGAAVKSIPLSHTIKEVSGHVVASFTFSLTPKEDNPANVGGSRVTNIASIDTWANNSNYQAKANCSLPLSNLYFYKVGNYAFTLAEESSSDELNFPHDSENKYDIFFQVINKLDSNNEPTGELEVNLLNEMYSYKADAKVPLRANFESVANYTYVSLESKVTGAGADADKYFKYAVDFDGVPEGSSVTITGQDETVEYGGETIQTSSTQNLDNGDVYVYLKHGQTVTIGDYSDGNTKARELPQGVRYTITKVDSDDGYDATLDDAATTTISKTVASIGSDEFAANNVTHAGNSKDATVNTGVFAASWPFLLAAALGIGGFIVFRRLSRI